MLHQFLISVFLVFLCRQTDRQTKTIPISLSRVGTQIVMSEPNHWPTEMVRFRFHSAALLQSHAYNDASSENLLKRRK